MTLSNQDSNKNNLTPEEKAENMTNFLKKLGELEYSNYKPDESFRLFEKMRGKGYE